MSKMEMKIRGHEPDLPNQPPPYSPPEFSNNPAVILVPPAVNTHRPNTVHQSTSSIPAQRTVVSGNIVVPKTMAPIPTPYVCPSCNHMVVTKVQASTTTKQHLFALLLFGIGCWLCICIPYCMPSCRKAHHYCPICNAYIGTYV